MSSRVHSIAFDAHDPRGLAEFWRQVLDYQVTEEDPDEVVIKPSNREGEPTLLFLSVPEGKAVKNRIHLDLAPDVQAAEVERVLALGARRVDIGQGEVPWVVLADPEGNEFCILSRRGE